MDRCLSCVAVSPNASKLHDFYLDMIIEQNVNVSSTVVQQCATNASFYSVRLKIQQN